jgi:hypothetical protein
LVNGNEVTNSMSMSNQTKSDDAAMVPPAEHTPQKVPELPPEIGGQKGPEPTRFGDWEKNGRCTDF